MPPHKIVDALAAGRLAGVTLVVVYVTWSFLYESFSADVDKPCELAVEEACDFYSPLRSFCQSKEMEFRIRPYVSGNACPLSSAEQHFFRRIWTYCDMKTRCEVPRHCGPWSQRINLYHPLACGDRGVPQYDSFFLYEESSYMYAGQVLFVVVSSNVRA